MAENIKVVIDDIEYLQTDNIKEFLKTLFLWRNEVYGPICKKTGEISTHLINNSNGKCLTISHEVNGWKNIAMIKNFYSKFNQAFDKRFYENMKEKIEAISTLTVVVWIQFILEPKFNFLIGYNSMKPSDKLTISKFLENCVEKPNIMKWYEYNLPTPTEYGCALSSESNELICGFYFFDSVPEVNLSKALSGFKSYGAEISQEKLDILKDIHGGELQIYFHVNHDGVQKIRLLVYYMNSDLETKILEKIDNNYIISGWDKFKKKFEKSGQSQYLLEFSVEGFSLSCSTQIGAEMDFNVFLETL